MAFHLQATLICLSLALVSIHAALPSEQYWYSMLPAAPIMPRAITLALRPAGQGVAELKPPIVLKKGKTLVKPKKPPTALYFLEKDLYPGNEMSLEINRQDNGASAFIPRRVSDSIPFSSDKLSTVFNKFSISPESKEADLMKETVNMCSMPATKGEVKQCVTSLESMIDFTVASLGKNVQADSTVAEKDSKFQKFRITNGMKQLTNDEAVVCHKNAYPYAVFFCHYLKATKSYMVPLTGADGTKANAIAVCHTDIAALSHEKVDFKALGVKAGTVPVCHFLPEYDVVFTKN